VEKITKDTTTSASGECAVSNALAFQCLTRECPTPERAMKTFAPSGWRPPRRSRLLVRPPPAPSRRRRELVEAPPTPIGPDSLADALLVDVRSVDSTIRVDVRYATANNFTGAPLRATTTARILLRREAAEALGRVQQRLRTGGLGLRVFDGYRPVRATLAMVRLGGAHGRGRCSTADTCPAEPANMGVAVDSRWWTW